jgi:hypothetical protein
MRKYILIIITTMVILSPVLSVGTVSAAQSDSSGVDAAITEVSVSPETPVPGELATMKITLRNFQTSPDSYIIETVMLRDIHGNIQSEQMPVRDLGRLAPGTSLNIPVSFSATSPGMRQLEVVVIGQASSGNTFRLTYPVTIQVTDTKPIVEINFPRPVEGVKSNATVFVANGLQRDVRNVRVQLQGDISNTRRQRIRPTLQAGETERFVFDVAPSRAGKTELTATVKYTIAGGPSRVANNTAIVETESVNSQIGFTTNTTRGQAIATVTNLGNAKVQNLVINANNENGTVSQRSIQSLKSGASRKVALPVDDIQPTNDPPVVNITSTYEIGESERTVHAGTIRLRHEVDINASVKNGAITAEIANVGNLHIDRIIVSGTAQNAIIERSVVRDLRPGKTRTIQLPVQNASGVEPAKISATYTIGDITSTTIGDQVTLRLNSSRVELTGVNVQSQGGHLLITGSASNIGLSTVDSVVIKVIDNASVTPVSPNREYFVGSVPASDFVSFEVTAVVDSNATAIPLSITYLSESERHVKRVSVPLQDEANSTTDHSKQGGLGAILPASIGVVVVGTVGVIVLIGWRNSDASD